MAPAETVAPKPKTTDLPEFDLDAKLREYALTVTRREPYQGGTRYILERCPFNADHGGTSSAIIRLASGAIVFKCQHNGCAERTWADVRRLKDPGVDNGAKYVNSNPSSIYCDCTAAESKRDKSVTDSVTAKPQKPLSERVEEWISGTTGWFSYEECDKELGIITPTDKDNRRQIFRRFKEGPNPKIESHPDNNKLFRKVNMAVRLIDFKSSLKRAPVALRFPFGIEQYFNTYPGNIIVVAGAADAGKTAFLLNVVRLNMYDFTIYYQSSEMGEQELASRLQNFPGLTLDEWNFTAEERSHDFADVIRPDCVNIIDYMELSSECYRVADYLRAIHDKLAGGVAIVALQKKRGADLGRGGDFGIEKPRLYLSMDKGSLTIQKAKNWVDPQKNPNGMAVNFKIVGGCQFTGIVDWYRTEAAK